jgi:hypothetical protein
VITFTTDQKALQELARAMRQESDGKELRKDLIKELRGVLEPAKTEAKSSIMGMSTAGMSSSPNLRKAVAQKVTVQARLSGKSTGVRLRARKTPNVRGFVNAPKRLNRRTGWRHPVRGNRDIWVAQMGKPEWFDDPVRRDHDKYRKAVLSAMNRTALRIKARTW